jgi:phenylalanine dehydrogenase
MKPHTGLKAIIALGPAVGGTRMRPYETIEETLEDVV